MTADPRRPLVRPFSDEDPLTYEELSGEGLALRALLAVLADTGAAVMFPTHLVPAYVMLTAAEVVAGWTLRPDLRLANGECVLTCTRVAPPYIPQPPGHRTVINQGQGSSSNLVVGDDVTGTSQGPGAPRG